MANFKEIRFGCLAPVGPLDFCWRGSSRSSGEEPRAKHPLNPLV
jgi:hypothetical protein